VNFGGSQSASRDAIQDPAEANLVQFVSFVRDDARKIREYANPVL
jgi:hypothetical protein